MLPENLTVIVAFCSLSVFVLLPLLSKSSLPRHVEKFVIRVTERRAIAIAIIFFAVISLRLLLLPSLGVPGPFIHDEFSYLLMSDTFAHGRLANPTHPMWVSFETIHVNWIPTYSSMYPPAQGAVLAIGQLLGHPWIGVLLSNAAMCALIVWMLHAWIPPRWAFLGGAIAALQLSFVTYWINSYWGGAVATAGGALVLGALGRIARRASVTSALLLGLGIAILANTRPYEGFLFCIPAMVYLFRWMAGKTGNQRRSDMPIGKVLLPPLASLLALGIFMTYYNWRLTGHPLLLPHVLNTDTYHTAQSFLWQQPRPALQYHNLQFENYYNVWERAYYHPTLPDALRVTREKFEKIGTLFLSRADFLLLPMVPFLFGDRKMRLLLWTLCAGLAGILAVVWVQAHYAAPLAPVLFALLVQTMRHMNTVRVKGRPVGAVIVRVIVIMLLVQVTGRALDHECDPYYRSCKAGAPRASVVGQLERMPNKHLVMVRYRSFHPPYSEWVYNGAEIDSAKILWAREMDPAQNEKLLTYFKDRQIWLLQPDEPTVEARQLRPYWQPNASSPR